MDTCYINLTTLLITPLFACLTRKLSTFAAYFDLNWDFLKFAVVTKKPVDNLLGLRNNNEYYETYIN